MEQRTAPEVERLELRTQATPAAVPGVRRAVVDFAELHGVGVPPDVALAVSEAVTNTVIHAYRDGRAGEVRVVACAEPDRLVVVVRDYGCGMSPHPDSPGLGLGLSVIGRLCTELNIERPEDGGGTRLRMCFAAS
ncbi:MAG TPA: ATP-binding protein [Solirubrobacteraceae bacterium]|nr:ATP-binding protein [Solirubrobacteraceae bacterium]